MNQKDKDFIENTKNTRYMSWNFREWSNNYYERTNVIDKGQALSTLFIRARSMTSPDREVTLSFAFKKLDALLNTNANRGSITEFLENIKKHFKAEFGSVASPPKGTSSHLLFLFGSLPRSN